MSDGMPSTGITRLRQENARLRRLVSDHPSAQTLRWLAPFIRADLEAGRFGEGLAPSVERELRAAVAWLDHFESEDQ